MRNIIIILLAAALVAAGAFVPQFLLARDPGQDIELDYNQVVISSESSSDYAWRLSQIGERYFGEGTDQLTTYISANMSSEEAADYKGQFMTQIFALQRQGILSEALADAVGESTEYRVSCYYIFDNRAVNGFQVAEFTCSGRRWSFTAVMDISSGKLAKLELQGQDLQFRPAGSASWYDLLRLYGDYLGMSQTAFQAPDTPISQTREYYNNITADRLCAAMSTQSWLEVRAIQDSHSTIVAAYMGG